MAKMRHCFYCGEAIGEYVDHDPLDTCGKQECEREARNEREQQRQDAHDRLDRENGW